VTLPSSVGQQGEVPGEDKVMAENMFDPTHYAKVRLPALQAETLPNWCYTSEAFYQREVERMFKRNWNFIGREDELPQPGDYAALDIFGEAIVIARDKAGRLRAFANTCRHRGTKLLDSSRHGADGGF
jgi:choline monooxygenase